jgi:hypothetical protein
MTVYQGLMAAATVVFGYVLLRFVSTLIRVDCGTERRYAGAGLLFAVAIPALATVQVSAIPTADLPLYALGSLFWVTLALAFSAYAVSRARELRVT